jgi:hypothetical protein
MSTLDCEASQLLQGIPQGVLNQDSQLDTLSSKWTQHRSGSVQLAPKEDNSAVFG